MDGATLKQQRLAHQQDKLSSRVIDAAVKLPDDIEAELKAGCESVMPVVNDEVVKLMEAHIALTMKFGTDVEKACYIEQIFGGAYDTAAPITDEHIKRLVARLINKRPPAFLTSGDQGVLRDGTLFNTFGETHDFTNLQNLDPERGGHFCLKEYISYDEMKLAAFVHASAKTPFMNDGRRGNKGADERTKPGVIKSGVVIGSVGARFERPNLMEWQDIIVCTDERIPGARPTTGDAVQYRVKQREMWNEFYGIDRHPTVAEAQQDTSGRFIKIEDDAEGRPQYFDGLVYKRMMKMRLAAVLQEADARGAEAKQPAYVHLVGLGLGVWAVEKIKDRQREIFDEAVSELLQELDLPNVSDVDIAHFDKGLEPKTTPKFGKGRINLHINTKNNPSSYEVNEKLKASCSKEGKLLVQDVAWDGNSFGGNEFRLGKSHHAASGDPAAACSAPVFAEGFNEALNPALAVDKIRVRRVGATTKKVAPVVVPDPEVAVVDPVVMEQGIRSRLQALARRLDRECLFDGKPGVKRDYRSDRINLRSGAYYEYGLTQYGTAYISYFDYNEDKKIMREHLIEINEGGRGVVLVKMYDAVDVGGDQIEYAERAGSKKVLSTKEADVALKKFFDKRIFANESETQFLNQRIGQIKQSRLNAQYLEQMLALKVKYAGKLTAGKTLQCVIDGEQHEIGINREGGFYVEKIMPLDPQGAAEEHNRHSHVLILTDDEKNVWFHSRREKYVDREARGRRGVAEKKYNEVPIDDIRHHGIHLEAVEAQLGKPPVEHLPDASAAASTTTPKRDLARSMVAKAKELGIKKWVSDLDGTLLGTHTVHNKDIQVEFFDGVYASGATPASYKLKDAKKSEAAVAKLFADLELLKEILAACKDEGIEFHVATRQYSWIAEDILKAAGIGEDLLPKDRIMGVEKLPHDAEGKRSDKALAVDYISLIPSADPSAPPTFHPTIYMDDMGKEFIGMRPDVVEFRGGRDLPQYVNADSVALENSLQKTTNEVEAVGFGFNLARAQSFDAQLAKMIRDRDQALAAAAIKAKAPAQIVALTQKMHEGCDFSANETISFPAPPFFRDDETNFYSIHHDGENLIVSLHVVAVERGIDHRYSVKINDRGEAVFVFNPSRYFEHDEEKLMFNENCIGISNIFNRDIFSGRNTQLDQAIQSFKREKVYAQIRAEEVSLGQTSLRFKRLAALRNDDLNENESGGRFDIKISGEGDASEPVGVFFQATVRDEEAKEAVRGSIYEFQFTGARLVIPQDGEEAMVVDARNEADFSDKLAKVDAAIEQEAKSKSKSLAGKYYKRCAGVYGESESFYLSLDEGFRVYVYQDYVEIRAATGRTKEDGQPEFALVKDKDVYCEKLGKVSEFAERTLQVEEARLAAARRGEPRGPRFTMVGETEDYYDASPPRRGASMLEEDGPRTARRRVSFGLSQSSPDSSSVSVAPTISVPAGVVLEEVSDKRKPKQHTVFSAAKEKMPQIVTNDKTATVPYESIDGGVKNLAEDGVFSKAAKRSKGRQPYDQSAVIKEMYESPIKTLYLREPTDKDGGKRSYSFTDDEKKYVTTNSAAYNDFFRSFAKKDLFDIDLSAVTQDSRFTNCSLGDGCTLPKGADWINKNTFSNCKIEAKVLSAEQVAKVEKLFGKDVVKTDGAIVIPQQEREMINEKPRGSCVPMPIKQFKVLPLAASAFTRGSESSV